MTLLILSTLGINAQRLTDEGVVINGTTWATRNVGGWLTDSHQAYFTEKPEDYGMHGPSLFPSCPKGWRLPTQYEFEVLISMGSQYKFYNGVFGVEFGRGANTIFLPAAGYVYKGETRDVGVVGNYSIYDEDYTSNKALMFDNSSKPYIYRTQGGLSKRCIKDNQSANSGDNIDFNKLKQIAPDLGNKPCIIYFYSNRVELCKKFSPIFIDIMRNYQGKFSFYLIDIDINRLVDRIPTVLYVKANGDAMMRQGLYSKEELQKDITKMFGI